MPDGEFLVVLLAAAVSVAGVAAARLGAGAAWWNVGAATLGGAVLLAASVFHFIPEAFHAGGAAPYILLAGAGAALVVDVLAGGHDGADGRALGLFGFNRSAVALAVLSVHSTLDGMLYAFSFGHDHQSGLLASAGLMLHELPEGAAAALLAGALGVRSSAVWAAAIAASAATTPLGWLFARMIEPSAALGTEMLFAATAGVLTYIGLRLVARGLLRRSPTAK